ncbi:hypothetical protein AAG906_004444 [Vitis piasezkii]
MHVSANRSPDMDNIKRYHLAHPPITALPTFSPAITVYLFPGASTAVRSPSAAGSSMIGGRGGSGWVEMGLWAVDLVGLLVVAVMVEETVELKLSHLNVGITVQLLIDTFDVVGVVHYGIAGSTNDSLLIGDVSVPKYVAQTSSWKWKVLAEINFT